MYQTMSQIKVEFKGVGKLIQANPQAADPLNEFAIKKSVITSKKKKSIEDHQRLRLMDMESCLYYDENIGVYIPGNWIIEAIGGKSHVMCKISRADIRGAVFTEEMIPLKYEGVNKVKSAEDIIRNANFTHVMLVKQKQVRIAKAFPIFHDWSFEAVITFDSDIIGEANLLRILNQASRYGGFGNFRPGYGRANCTKVG